jgi:multidrug resistance protein MdtO
MAANAVERDAAPGTKWLRLLAPDPERLEFTTRLAIICALTTLAAEIYQTPDPALTTYIVFFLNRPERTMSFILSVAFVVIITSLIGLLFIVLNIVGNDPMWRVISIAVISFSFLFLASASRLQPVAGTLALIVGYGLDLFGMTPSGELATRALLYVWLFIGIPAGVSLLVNLILAPAPGRTAAQAIADRLKLCTVVLRHPESPARRELAAKVRDGVAPILEQLKLAGIEKSEPLQAVRSLQQAALSCFAVMSAVDTQASSPEVELPGAVRMKLADAVEQIAHVVRRGGHPAEVTLNVPAEAGLSPLAGEVVAAIREGVARFAEPGAPKPAAAKKEGGFFVAGAFTNPEHVQYALKTTAAAVFCYLLYSLLDWPGIHTCFITCYIVSQGTAAESVEKLSLRLIGCLIGAAAGYAAIVFLVPALTSIGGLMIAVLVGAWAAGYVAAGSPRISYAGFQIAFAFFLCIIQGSAPSFDLSTARDRVIGIVIGNLVAYFALVHVWPVSITRRIDPALAAAFRQLAQVVSAKERRERWLLASEIQGALTKIETDVALAHYEPASIRSSAAWLSARRQLVENGQTLGTLLPLSADIRGPSRVDVVMRLERLAARLAKPSDPSVAPSQVTESAHGWQTLPARVDRCLRALEETLAPGIGGTEAAPHARA